MKTVFADTSYWVALLNPRDSLHRNACDVSQSLEPFQIITSEFVLLETMKLLLKSGLHLKHVAYTTIKSLQRSPDVEIIPSSSRLFREALAVYIQHDDKEWDGIDCASYCIMKEYRISEILSADHHFKQMGFKVLLGKS